MNSIRLNSPASRMRALLWLFVLLVALCLAEDSRARACIDYGEYPHIVGSIEIGNFAFDDVAVVGNHAFLAARLLGDARVVVADISNPSVPIIVGDINTEGSANGLVVVDQLLFLAVGSAGLRVVDISDPTSPVVIGAAETPGTAYEVAVDGTYAYIADGLLGLQVMDISNPAAPTLVGSLDTMQARGITVAGGFAYVADDYTGAPFQSRLQVIDISNPSSPMLAGSVVVPGQAQDVAVAGSHAYVACSSQGFQVVDIASPVSPQLRGNLDLETTNPVSVTAWSESLVYYGSGGSVGIVDVGDPNAPTQLTQIAVPNGATGIALTGTHAYTANGIGGFHVVDITNPVSPPVVGEVAESGFLAVAGNYAYQAGGFIEFRVVDISNPEAPVTLTEMTNGDEGANDVTVTAEHALVIGRTRLRVFDISDPGHPVQVITLAVPGRHVAVSGNYAYVAGIADGLRVLDMSQPGFPTVALLLTQGEFLDVAVAGNYAFCLDELSGLTVVDVSIPTSPTVVGSLQLSSNADCLTAAGSYVYIGNTTSLLVVDASDPTSPALVGTAFTPGRPSELVVDGDLAYIADATSLQIADISVPEAPQLIGTYGGRCQTVAVSEDLALISAKLTFGMPNSLKILPAQCATTAGIAEAVLAPNVASMETAFPNPFTGSALIPYTLHSPGQVSLRIYDISGRLVRVLEEQADGRPGRHLVSWNGRDAQGQALPAGVYLCRLDASGRTETQRLTLLK